MEEKINSVKAEIVCDYINQIETAIDVYNPVFENSEEIIEVLIEVVNVFAEDIPQIKDSILLRSGTQIRDANTAIALLKMYLAKRIPSLPSRLICY